MHSRIIARIIASLFFVLTGFFLGASFASAAEYELTGWAWGGDDNTGQALGACPPPLPGCGVGWISFNNKTDASVIEYKVVIDSANGGDLSGYAWGSNIGWITFNAAEMQKCSTNTGDVCPPGPAPVAHINFTFNGAGAITGGTGVVTGWARACTVFVSGCSGPIRPILERANWDGWIRLGVTSGSITYGWKVDMSSAPYKFLEPTTACPTCYAWGGQANNNTPIGWLMTKNLQINTTTPISPPSLSLNVSPLSISLGQSATLSWITGGDIVSCNASNSGVFGDWVGPKSFAPSWLTQSVTPTALGTYTYNLQCTDASSVQTPMRSVLLDVVDSTISMDGVCGTPPPKKTPPTTNLCVVGSLKPPGVVANGDTWEWTCEGVNGGDDSPLCSSEKLKFFKIKIF